MFRVVEKCCGTVSDVNWRFLHAHRITNFSVPGMSHISAVANDYVDFSTSSYIHIYSTAFWDDLLSYQYCCLKPYQSFPSHKNVQSVFVIATEEHGGDKNITSRVLSNDEDFPHIKLCRQCSP